MSKKLIMRELQQARGYQVDFLSSDLKVPFPRITRTYMRQVAPVIGSEDPVLHYHNFSLVQNGLRGFPFFTASNIDGQLFKELRRKDIFPGGKDRWRRDPRIAKDHQWGLELYRAKMSDFDRGHMTKREDVQWGTDANAKAAAQLTFYYTNAVPQRKEVNQAIWRSLEDYILHTEAVKFGLKINLFTGPVFRRWDPIFVTEVKGQKIHLPTLFWKVIYYSRDGVNLKRVAFMVGQKKLLQKYDIVHKRRTRGMSPEDELFNDFEQADTFQVSIKLLERIAHLRFFPATDPFKDDRPTRLVMRQVNVRSLGGGGKPVIEGLAL